MNSASARTEPYPTAAGQAKTPILVSFCPADDAAADGGITAFLRDVAKEYSATFFETPEFITDRTPPPWGQRDHWGEALRAGAPLVAMISRAFSEDADRVAEVIGVSGDDLDDPTGRAVLLPWERVSEPEDEEIPTLGHIPVGSSEYEDAVRGVAYWIKGVVEILTEVRPAEAEWDRGEMSLLPRRPIAQEQAFEARQYARLSAQIIHNASVLDAVSIAIFEGFERVMGSDWTHVDADGACDLAVALSPRVAESKIATRTMLRAWKEARRILYYLHELAESADYHPFRDRIKVMLWDLAEALDVWVDVQTLTELQFGAGASGDLRPAFRALLRNAHARQRVRAGALACLAAVGENTPEPEALWNLTRVRRELRGKKKRPHPAPPPAETAAETAAEAAAASAVGVSGS